MRVKKRYFAYLLFTIFTLFGINNDVFERIFFFNEILSLAGFIIFVAEVLENKNSIPNSHLYKLILILILLGLFHLIISISTFTSIYYYLRNSVIIYSMFSFFIGFYFLKYQHNFFSSIKKFLGAYIILFQIFPTQLFLDAFVGNTFFPALFKKFTYKNFILLILLNIVFAVRYGVMTAMIVAAVLFGIWFLQKYINFKIVFILGIISFISFFVYLSPNFALHKKGGYHLYGNVQPVIHSNFFLSLDDNTTWRAVFWYRLMTERFPENLFGIGFGTPLLNYIKGADTIPESVYDDEYDIHVNGAHNAYITLFIRLGLPSILLIVLIFSEVMKEFYKYRNYYIIKSQCWFFLSFLTISIVCLFNPVLETPTGASLFWVLLGFVARAIEIRKNHNISFITRNIVIQSYKN